MSFEVKDNSAPAMAQTQTDAFANVPLPDITAHPHLSSSAKLLYGILRRLHCINTKKGKEAFRVLYETLGKQMGKSPRTIERLLWELRGKPNKDHKPEFDPLIVAVKTGRSNYYKLLPLESSKLSTELDLDGGSEEVLSRKNAGSDPAKQRGPHYKASLEINECNESAVKNVDNIFVDNWRNHLKEWKRLSPEIQKNIRERCQRLGFGYTPTGKQCFPPERAAAVYGVSTFLSFLEKTEDVIEEDQRRKVEGIHLICSDENYGGFLMARLQADLREGGLAKAS